MKAVADIATMFIVLGAIMVLVRPNSQGPKFVNAVGGSFGHVLSVATGGGVF